MSNRTVMRLHLTVAVALVTLLLPSVVSAGTMESELDTYWGKKRDVKVIQKRMFMKDGRWEFTVNGGVIPNDDFYMYGPLGARISYFIDEDFAVEVNGAYILGSRSDLESFLEDQNLLIVDLPQRLEWYAGATGIWSPIHGKFGIFTTKLTHFDLFLSFGAGVMGTKLYSGSEYKERAYDIQGNLGLGFRFFVLDWLAVRIDYHHYLYQAAGGGVSYPAELSLGVSFFTSAPK